VFNSQQAPNDILGVVIPLRSVNLANGGVVGGPPSLGGWQASRTWEVWDRKYKAWRLREGLIANLMPVGNFWLRFPGGANYGDQVYASPIDGYAVSGALAGTIQTSFFVCGEAGVGALAIVSSNAQFGVH
jgi:hypothetical protein